jgi:hypothetical protein
MMDTELHEVGDEDIEADCILFEDIPGTDRQRYIALGDAP